MRVDFAARKIAVRRHRKGGILPFLGSMRDLTPFNWMIVSAEWDKDEQKSILVARALVEGNGEAGFHDIYLTYGAR